MTMIQQAILNFPKSHDGFLWRHQGSPHLIAPHVHDELELNLVVRGRGLYIIEGERVEMRPFQLLWLMPKDAHLLLEADRDFEMWIGVFRCQRWRKLLQGSDYSPLLLKSSREVLSANLPYAEGEWLQQLCERLVPDREDSALFNSGVRYLMLKSWRLCQEFQQKQQANPERQRAMVHPAVFKALLLLEQEPGLHDRDAIAAQAGLSPSRLSVLFARETGQTLTEYRHRKCLQRFFHLRERNRYRTLLDLALDAGFGSYTQFYRVYRRETGERPGE